MSIEKPGQRRVILPTEPPPPPPDKPGEDEADEGPRTIDPATPRTGEPPAHAPSRRVGGKAVVQRRESPPEGTPIVIDQKRRSELAQDRRTHARAQAGLSHAAITSFELVR